MPRESPGQSRPHQDLPPHARSGNAAALFIRQFLKAPTQVGAIAPSSRFLAARMLETIDFKSIKALAEFGPGAGVFTGEILARLSPGTTFMTIERNPDMAAEVRRRFPSVTLHEGSAENIGEYCEQAGLPRDGGLDAIVSGLPFAAFPDALQVSILDAAVKALRPGGQLVTFAYYQGLAMPAGKRFAAKLPRYFSQVTRSRGVLRNLPPAFVYICRK